MELGTCAWSGGPAGLREPEGDGISGLAQAGLLRAAAPESCYLWEGPARGVGRGAGPARGMSHPRPGQWEQTGGSGRERPSAPSDLLVFIPQALHVGVAEPRRRSSGLRTWTADLDCWVGISSPPLPSSGPGLLRCPGSLLNTERVGRASM